MFPGALNTPWLVFAQQEKRGSAAKSGRANSCRPAGHTCCGGAAWIPPLTLPKGTLTLPATSRPEEQPQWRQRAASVAQHPSKHLTGWEQSQPL